MSTCAWIQVKTSDWSEWKSENEGQDADHAWKAWANEIKNWPNVDSVWSTTGSWDWIIKLKGSGSTWDDAKKTMWKIKTHKWVADTNTWWGEEL